MMKKTQHFSKIVVCTKIFQVFLAMLVFYHFFLKVFVALVFETIDFLEDISVVTIDPWVIRGGNPLQIFMGILPHQ